MNVAKYRIDLLLNEIWPVHCEPGRTGPNAWEVEKSKIDEMLELGRIEVDETNGPLP